MSLRYLSWLAVGLGWVWLGLGANAQDAPRGAERGRSLEDYRRFALSQQADAERGRLLFADEGRLGCAKCHTVDGSGGKAGPDLFAIGDKFARPDLIEAVLLPSSNIAVGYGTTVVETRGGEEVSGILKRLSEEGVELMGADGKAVVIPRAEIKERRNSSVSLMPDALQAGLTMREFNDLIEYLVQLREPARAQADDRRTPGTIPALARMVALRPVYAEPLKAPKIDGVESGLTGYWPIPGEQGAALVTHQTGIIWFMEQPRRGDAPPKLWLDLTAETYSKTGPNGMLGLAFHPKFRSNRKYYLKYHVFEGKTITTAIVERRMRADFRQDSGEPPRRVISVPSPGGDHGGGCVEFGPDGYLYFGPGDSGPHRDPQGNAQNMGLLLGKICRIDVDRRDPGMEYGIPADNPFVGRPGVRPEIWASGFRNPWRFCFDPADGTLWATDVGQDRMEEVMKVRKGENHGWNVYEAFERFSDAFRKSGETYVAPLMAYRRRYGNSITGGYVYRGRSAPAFDGVYVFGDFNTKMIFGLQESGGEPRVVRHLATCPERLVSFGVDGEGELYAVGFEGTIYRMDFSGCSLPTQ
ncbi:MAG: c-type cytochrome [Verrucomicrobia bacterium]|nr:c-type cytochrome [Verrucomicrobiota bacterium]